MTQYNWMHPKKKRKKKLGSGWKNTLDLSCLRGKSFQIAIKMN